MPWRKLFKAKTEDIPEDVDQAPKAPEPSETGSDQPQPGQVEAEKKQREEPQRKRSTQVIIRFTPEELEEFNKAVALSGKSRPDFILDTIREHPTIVCEGLPELMVELKKQGVNLNQAMKLANEMHDTRRGEIYEAIKKQGAAVGLVVDFIDRWNIKINSRRNGLSR